MALGVRIDFVGITLHLSSVAEIHGEGSAAREYYASPVGDYHLCLVWNGISDRIATHIPTHTDRRLSLDARDVYTQIADGIRHGERIAAIKLLSGRVQCDPEVRVDVPMILDKVLFRSQKLLVEAVVGVCDRCGVGLALPFSLIFNFGYTAILYGLDPQSFESICILDHQVVNELVVWEVCVLVHFSKLAGSRGHGELNATSDVLVWNRLKTLSIKIVKPIATDQIVGIIAAIV